MGVVYYKLLTILLKYMHSLCLLKIKSISMH